MSGIGMPGSKPGAPPGSGPASRIVSPRQGRSEAGAAATSARWTGTIVTASPGRIVASLAGAVIKIGGLAGVGAGRPITLQAQPGDSLRVGGSVLVTIDGHGPQAARVLALRTDATLPALPGPIVPARLRLDGTGDVLAAKVRLAPPGALMENLAAAARRGDNDAPPLPGPPSLARFSRAVVGAAGPDMVRLHLVGASLDLPARSMTLAPGALVAVEIAELLPESLPVDEARACRRWRVDGCLGLTLMEACRRQRRSAELGARAGRRGDIQADGTARSRWNGYAHLPDGPASCPIQLEAMLGDGDASVRLCLNADELADSMGELPVPRLLIEVEFAALGLVRLELKAPSGYLQLVVRSRLILPPAARSRLADLFGTACQLTGRRGAIHFHSTLPQMTAGRQGPPAAGLPALGRGALPLDPEPAAG